MIPSDEEFHAMRNCVDIEITRTKIQLENETRPTHQESIKANLRTWERLYQFLGEQLEARRESKARKA